MIDFGEGLEFSRQNTIWRELNNEMYKIVSDSNCYYDFIKLQGGKDENDNINFWSRHIISKKAVPSEITNLKLNGPTYVSIDMDVGSLSSVFSARFMNCYGLNRREFINLLLQVKNSIRINQVPLVGMDIMEIDIHLLEAAEYTLYKDNTKYIAGKALEILL